MFDWISVDKRLPPRGLVVDCILRSGVIVVLSHNHEHNSGWLDNGMEFDFDVIAWRYKAPWLVRICMKFGLLPVHHALNKRLRD